MARPPEYRFMIAAGLNNAGAMQNVELLTDGERYFNAPALVNDYILRQPVSGGLMVDRGYQQFTWQSNLWRGQYHYLYGTLLAGTLTNNVTFQTLRTADKLSYSVWQGKLTLPQMNEFQRNFQMYGNVQWQFTRCVRIG